MIWKIILSFLIFLGALSAQDITDENSIMLGWDQSAENLPYELNGFIRGAFFGGKTVNKVEPELKSGYGELGLKLRVRKSNWGNGFAEIRFRRGLEFNQSLSECKLREAYINTYIGRWDLRIGHQIVVWGRADGFNPTNNITPQNMIVRSTDEDDRREGNFLIRLFYHMKPFRCELIWVPQYSPSVLPTQFFPFPSYVQLGESVNPEASLKNSSIAIKLDLGLKSLDGSVSFFRGYMPTVGIDLSSIEFTDILEIIATVVPRPYKMDVFGFDFATTVGLFGLRGELAYRDPKTANGLNYHIPNPDIQYVLGIDKSKGNVSVIFQYIGRMVLDYEEFQATGSPLDELKIKNRMIASQSEEVNHSLFIRPSVTLLHETMQLEIMGYYNVTTKEILLRPVLSYDIVDALKFIVGGELYTGPKNTLFGSIEEPLSSGFIELNITF